MWGREGAISFCRNFSTGSTAGAQPTASELAAYARPRQTYTGAKGPKLQSKGLWVRAGVGRAGAGSPGLAEFPHMSIFRIKPLGFCLYSILGKKINKIIICKIICDTRGRKALTTSDKPR